MVYTSIPNSLPDHNEIFENYGIQNEELEQNEQNEQNYKNEAENEKQYEKLLLFMFFEEQTLKLARLAFPFENNENEDEVKYLERHLMYKVGPTYTVFNYLLLLSLFQFKVVKCVAEGDASQSKGFEYFCDVSQNYKMFIKKLDEKEKITAKTNQKRNEEKFLYWDKNKLCAFCVDAKEEQGFYVKKEATGEN